MSRMSPIIFTLVVLAAVLGCASAKSEQEEKLDALWREGYGSNNPNPERIKKGLEPLNFDGSKPAPWWQIW